MVDISQSNYQSNQNYDVDILTLFKHYVTGGSTIDDNNAGSNIGIDDVRGQISASVVGTKTADLITSLNINPNSNNLSPTPNTTTPVLLAQESRCHAFYRILGFPIVNSDASAFYNPGFDIVKGTGITRQITLSKKITIASNVGSSFEAISAARENWAAATSQIFSVPTSVEAGVLSLTSGTYNANSINKRSFNILQNVSNSFDYSISHQTYNIANQNCLVGDKGAQSLSLFQDAPGNTINTSSAGTTKTPRSSFFSHQHIITPFNVDPRIDFSIWGNNSSTSNSISRRVAVPFVPNASYLQVNSTSTAIRPVIEQVIRQRVYQVNQIPEAGDAIANAQAIITNDPNIGKLQFMGSTPLSNIFSGNVFNLSQQNAFADTLSTIQTMIKKLVISLQKIQAVQGIYYWLPIPNTSGPEGGFQVRDIIFSQNFPSNLVTTEDFNIIISQVNILFSNLTIVSAQSNAVPDPGGYAFGSGAPSVNFNKNSTDALGDVSSKTMDTLSKKRNKLLNDAGNALQIIEMILGEFSGLGLCDIIAVIGALYTMPLPDLLGLLDIDAYARAQSILGSSIPSQNTSVTSSFNSLLQATQSYYQIMDQIFIDTFGNQSLNL